MSTVFLNPHLKSLKDLKTVNHFQILAFRGKMADMLNLLYPSSFIRFFIFFFFFFLLDVTLSLCLCLIKCCIRPLSWTRGRRSHYPYSMPEHIYRTHQRSELSSPGSFSKIFLLIDFSFLHYLPGAEQKRMTNVTWLGRGTVIVYEFR